ncbi:hypothetical protein NKR23_g2696 [Pleurostoma richardsiae]|uniref:Uncharacterized protein n=1 Tax=Pleurostoma richardsiae TaxID=41990 RepID=A0AA38S0P2_9PEZI|nr:hypothetical protein NKR23_g2696 [Pleurostoma richardsiae]
MAFSSLETTLITATGSPSTPLSRSGLQPTMTTTILPELTPTERASTAQQDNTSSGSVSIAAAVGIGLGILVATLLVAGSALALMFCLRRRRQRSERTRLPPTPPPKDEWAGPHGFYELPSETVSQKVYEMCGAGSPGSEVPLRFAQPLTPYSSPPAEFGFLRSELDTRGTPAELG